MHIRAITRAIVDRTEAPFKTTATSPLEGLLRNDHAVVEQLYAAHFPAVRAYVQQNSGAESDAQDVFQDAITVLWLNLKEGRLIPTADLDPGAYLFRVAKNKWLDVLRSARHKRTNAMLDERVHQQHAVMDDDVDDRIQRLREVYSKLDERCRVVLDQFYYEKKDLATIAAAMGVEEESMRTIKYRCMMKLRDHKRLISIGSNGNGKL